MKINSSSDLVQEKQILESELITQKRKIQRDVKQIKDDLKPAVRILSVAEKFASRDNTRPLVNAIVETECHHLLRKTHFLIRLIVPRLITNFVSNVITDAVYLKKAIDYRKFNGEDDPSRLLPESNEVNAGDVRVEAEIEQARPAAQP
jgi:hypothetical protein